MGKFLTFRAAIPVTQNLHHAYYSECERPRLRHRREQHVLLRGCQIHRIDDWSPTARVAWDFECRPHRRRRRPRSRSGIDGKRAGDVDGASDSVPCCIANRDGASAAYRGTATGVPSTRVDVYRASAVQRCSAIGNRMLGYCCRADIPPRSALQPANRQNWQDSLLSVSSARFLGPIVAAVAVVIGYLHYVRARWGYMGVAVLQLLQPFLDGTFW